MKRTLENEVRINKQLVIDLQFEKRENIIKSNKIIDDLEQQRDALEEIIAKIERGLGKIACLGNGKSIGLAIDLLKEIKDKVKIKEE